MFTSTTCQSKLRQTEKRKVKVDSFFFLPDEKRKVKKAKRFSTGLAHGLTERNGKNLHHFNVIEDLNK